MSVPTRRERLRATTLTEIRDAARRQLREVGAAQLSLRGVAADLGMSPAGLYRYFANRDALLTALIADAFGALADAVEQARDADPDADVADRLLAAMRAYRRRALDQPHEFGLAFGNPIPGYAAPQDGPTTAATRRIGAAFAPLFVEAWRQGRLRVPDEPPSRAAPRYAAALQPDLPVEAAATALAAWTRLHGLVSLEAFGHLDWLSGDTTELAEDQLRRLLTEVIA